MTQGRNPNSELKHRRAASTGRDHEGADLGEGGRTPEQRMRLSPAPRRCRLPAGRHAGGSAVPAARPAAPAARTSQSALPPPRRDAGGGAARRRRREEAGGGGGAGERSSWLLPPPASRTASVSGAGTFPAPPAGAAQVTGRGRAVARPFPSLVLCPLCSRPFRQAPAPRWARLPPLGAVSSGAERRQRGLGAVVSLPSAGHSRRLFAGAFVAGEGSYAVGCAP